MVDVPKAEVLHEGRFLALVRRGGWEYVTRTRVSGVVAIVPLHDDGRVVLVEQDRPPVQARVLELPAGLVGDVDAGEAMLAAAQRELLEETGYAAERWELLPSALSSGGLCDESVVFYLARGLHQRGSGGGVEGESIITHEVPLTDLPRWLHQQRHRGLQVDAKLMAGIWLAQTWSETLR